LQDTTIEGLPGYTIPNPVVESSDRGSGWCPGGVHKWSNPHRHHSKDSVTRLHDATIVKTSVSNLKAPYGGMLIDYEKSLLDGMSMKSFAMFSPQAQPFNSEQLQE